MRPWTLIGKTTEINGWANGHCWELLLTVYSWPRIELTESYRPSSLGLLRPYNAPKNNTNCLEWPLLTPIAALLNISHGAGVLLGDADFNIQVELYLN